MAAVPDLVPHHLFALEFAESPAAHSAARIPKSNLDNNASHHHQIYAAAITTYGAKLITGLGIRANHLRRPVDRPLLGDPRAFLVKRGGGVSQEEDMVGKCQYSGSRNRRCNGVRSQLC